MQIEMSAPQDMSSDHLTIETFIREMRTSWSRSDYIRSAIHYLKRLKETVVVGCFILPKVHFSIFNLKGLLLLILFIIYSHYFSKLYALFFIHFSALSYLM